jgi:hypothetical protein
MHRGTNGRLSYSGVFVPEELVGDHSHSMDRPDAVRDTSTICSAAMLIDLSKVGHLRFDSRYVKYFHDLDYGLQAWESGARVVCTPDVTVTHIGGGTLKQGSSSAHVQWERDRGAFVQSWLESGRLGKLRRNVWQQRPYLDRVYAVPHDLEDILLSDRFASTEAWKRAIRDVLELAETMPVYAKSLPAYVERWSQPARGHRPPWYAYRLTYLRHRLSGGTYNEDVDALRMMLDPVVDRWIEDNARVVIYGAGVHTEQLFKSTRLLRAGLVGMADGSSSLQGTSVWGLPVVAPNQIMELKPDAVLISSKAWQAEINTTLEKLLPASVERLLLYADDGSVKCPSEGLAVAS